ncbi:Uncharacterised protein [Achromobacter kerstersii]|nr:Uncharacterised protein [Achromobacter kerstersii]
MRHIQQDVTVPAQLVHGLPAAACGIAVVLAQREQPAGRKRAGRARAFKAHQRGLMGAQGARHALFSGVVIGVAAMAGIVVVLKHGQGFDLHLRTGLRGVRGQRALVPGRACDRVRAYRLHGRKARDAVARFGGVAAMKAQGRCRVFGTRRVGVEDDDAMARAAACGLRIVLLVFEAIAQARFGQDALHEIQVRLAVLRASGARCQGGSHFKGERGLGIIRKHLADDVLHRQVLIDEAVAPQGQRGHPRRGVQAVAGQAAVCAQGIDTVDHRMPAPHRAVGLQQADADLLAQQRRHVELGAGRQAVQRQREQTRDAFAQGHVFGHQLCIQRRAHPQQPRLLRQGGDVQRRVGRGVRRQGVHRTWRCSIGSAEGAQYAPEGAGAAWRLRATAAKWSGARRVDPA